MNETIITFLLFIAMVVAILFVAYLNSNKSGSSLITTEKRMVSRTDTTIPEIVKPLSHHITQKLITEIGTKCCYPNCKETITLEVHHIIPRTKGGSNKENNLIVLCNNHHKLADVGGIPKQRLKQHSIAKIKRDKRFDRE